MDFSTYSELAGSTAIYPNRGSNLVYPTLGLSGETGEVAEKIKKIIRDKNGVLSEEDRAAIAKELGDVLWYVASLSFEIGVPMEQIATMNYEKLKSRKERNVLSGSGDER